MTPRSGDHETAYLAPSMRGQGGAGALTRAVWRFEPGGPQPSFKGSGGWVSHGAFAPLPICLRPDRPMVSLGP